MMQEFWPILPFTREQMTVGDCLTVNGQDVPIYLVGDSAYPILSWLIKPYAISAALAQQQKHSTIGYAEHVWLLK